jgi:hypothetical protein
MVRALFATGAAYALTTLCNGGVAMAAPFLYSLSYTGGVKIFDTPTQTFVPNSIALPPAAVGFALSPSGDRLYLSGSSTIAVIDTSNNSLITNITMPACLADDGQRMSVRPQNDILYFACAVGVNAFSLYPITISGNTYLPQLPIVVNATGRAVGIAVNRAGTRLWIARQSVDVLAVDLATNGTTPIPGIVDPNALTDIAYDPNLNRVYIPTTTGVIPIDGANDVTLPAIGTAIGSVLSVAPSPDGSRVYALEGFPSFGVAAFTAAGGLIGPVTGLPSNGRTAIAVSPVDRTIYALSTGACSGFPQGLIWAIDPVTLAAGPGIAVPGTYCEPRAAGQLIIGPTVHPMPGGQPIPTLSIWALIMLVAVLASFGLVGITRAARSRT